jgi:hypothetical protein
MYFMMSSIWMGTAIWMRKNLGRPWGRLVGQISPSFRFTLLAHRFVPAGIPLSPGTLSEFMTTLTSSPHSHAISFREFRDFLLLLPRKASTAEIYQYYEMRRYLGDDGRGAARVTMEGL